MCDGLKKRYGLVHISPGQILRDEVCKESDLGLQVPPGCQIPTVIPVLCMTRTTWTQSHDDPMECSQLMCFLNWRNPSCQWTYLNPWSV